MIKVTLKDGSVREFENALSLAEIAKSISPKLLEKATVAKVNGELCDLRDVVDADVEVEILSFEDKEGKKLNNLKFCLNFWKTEFEKKKEKSGKKCAKTLKLIKIYL